MFGQRRNAARYFSSIAALAAIALSLGGQAHGEDFFAGKQIRLIVPAGPAGGYGLYGQLAAQHLGRFIPGNPNIVLSYMPAASLP
jgi:tripartite-type tricarboxylate transporter receptor subunit TctC